MATALPTGRCDEGIFSVEGPSSQMYQAYDSLADRKTNQHTKLEMFQNKMLSSVHVMSQVDSQNAGPLSIV